MRAFIPTLLSLAAATAIAAVAAEEPPEVTLPDPGRTHLRSSSVEIPLDLTHRHPVVEASVDGRGPYRFVVDTGAAYSLLDQAIADELRLPVVGRQTIASPNATHPIEGSRVRASRIDAGGLLIEEPVLATMDLAGYSGGLLQGVLGLSHFRGLLLTYDYPGSRLIVTRGALDPADPETVALASDPSFVEFPMRIGDAVLRTHLDTGSPGGFTLPKALEPELRFLSPPARGGTIRLIGGEHPIWRARLDGTLRIGGLAYDNPDVTLTTVGDDFGNIGYEVLQRLVLTLDRANNLLRFHRPPTAATVAQGERPRRPRLGVAFAMSPGGFIVQDGGLLVQRVDAGGLAENAGLRAGDVLLAVDGTPLAGAGIPEIGRRLGTALPLALEILRDGEQLRLTVRLPGAPGTTAGRG